MSLVPPPVPTASLFLPDDAATDWLGAILSASLRADDVLLLSGPIGAGKTHLARALIRTRFGADTDVPSPSFTLVQTYGRGEDAIWHADLYRLSHPDEVRELGLEDAFGHALCLVEWPDRLAGSLPPGALDISLTAMGDGRQARLSGGRDGVVRAVLTAWQGVSDAR